jgi:hypothetical protein
MTGSFLKRFFFPFLPWVSFLVHPLWARRRQRRSRGARTRRPARRVAVPDGECRIPSIASHSSALPARPSSHQRNGQGRGGQGHGAWRSGFLAGQGRGGLGTPMQGTRRPALTCQEGGDQGCGSRGSRTDGSSSAGAAAACCGRGTARGIHATQPATPPILGLLCPPDRSPVWTTLFPSPRTPAGSFRAHQRAPPPPTECAAGGGAEERGSRRRILELSVWDGGLKACADRATSPPGRRRSRRAQAATAKHSSPSPAARQWRRPAPLPLPRPAPGLDLPGVGDPGAAAVHRPSSSLCSMAAGPA